MLIKYFGSRNLHLAICKNNDEPVAMTILTYNKFGRWQTFQPSQAPIGLWINNQPHRNDAIINSLLHSMPNFYLSLSVTQLDPEHYQSTLNGNSYRLDYISTSRIQVRGDYLAFWEARGKNLKQNLKRQRNKLNRENIVTRLDVISNPDGIEQAIVEYGEMESKGWKSASGTAVHLNNAQGQFYKEVLIDYSRRSNGTIYRYCYNDKPVAMDLCVSGKDTIVFLKTTYDEHHKSTSPAMLMHQEIFEKIFKDQQLKTIEFYGKSLDWHKRWTEDERTLYHITQYRWKWLKQAHLAAKLRK